VTDSPFEQAVQVAAGGRGRYGAVVDPGWSGPVAPNGGVLSAIMVRAAEAELGAGAPPPRTIDAHFLDVPAPGPVEVVVEVLRRGKRVAACDVRLCSDSRLVCQATILCSAARSSDPPLPLRRMAPNVPPASAVAPIEVDAVPGAPAMLGRMELRPCFGPAMFSGGGDAVTGDREAVIGGGDAVTGDREAVTGGGDAVTGGWAAFRGEHRPLDAARLCALCDLWWPPLYGRLTTPAALPTLQLTVYLRDTSARVPPPVLARFATATVDEGHLEERGELWSTDGRLLAESTQLALLVLS
jgi:hypothetical protein